MTKNPSPQPAPELTTPPPTHTLRAASPLTSWAEVTQWPELERIRDRALNALVLRRQGVVDDHLRARDLVELRGSSGPLADRGLRVTDLAEQLCAHLPEGEARAFLQADIARCLQAFRGLVESTFLASLGIIAQTQCPKFHADRVTLRMLVTYVGPGTEWLEDAHVRREALGRADADLEAANQRIQCCPEGLHRAQTGDVLLLKGECWPGNTGRGAVHRSPRLAAGDERLVLTLSAGLGMR